MAQRIVVIGGGAAGIGAAGAAKGTDRSADVRVYAEFEDVGQDDVAVLTPPDENRPVYTSHQGIELDSISGPYGRFLLAGARACVAPGASSGRKPMQHPGEELVHVTSGMLEFTVTGQKYTVERGSTLHFQGDQPHTWRNPGKAEARAVWMALRPQ